MRVLDALRRPLVAIDVGTAVTRVSFGPGGVREQPSVIREGVTARAAMRSGVVADIAGVAGVVHALLASRVRPWQRRPGALVCAPTDVSTPERESLIEAVAEGGASVVAVVPEPLAAAVGTGLDLSSEYASALVDIGDGVTDFAVFRNGTIVTSSARRIGCGTLRGAVREWLELHRGMHGVSDESIEAIVRSYCRSGASAEAVGLTRDDLEMLLDPAIDEIASFLAATVRALPDEVAAEVIESGIHLTGGGAHLDLLVRRIERALGLSLARTSEPLHAVIRGATRMLGNERLLAQAR